TSWRVRSRRVIRSRACFNSRWAGLIRTGMEFGIKTSSTPTLTTVWEFTPCHHTVAEVVDSETTETQRHRDTETQRHRDTETQRHKGCPFFVSLWFLQHPTRSALISPDVTVRRRAQRVRVLTST